MKQGAPDVIDYGARICFPPAEQALLVQQNNTTPTSTKGYIGTHSRMFEGATCYNLRVVSLVHGGAQVHRFISLKRCTSMKETTKEGATAHAVFPCTWCNINIDICIPRMGSEMCRRFTCVFGCVGNENKAISVSGISFLGPIGHHSMLYVTRGWMLLRQQTNVFPSFQSLPTIGTRATAAVQCDFPVLRQLQQVVQSRKRASGNRMVSSKIIAMLGIKDMDIMSPGSIRRTCLVGKKMCTKRF